MVKRAPFAPETHHLRNFLEVTATLQEFENQPETGVKPQFIGLFALYLLKV